jgi:solute carrier family 25 carnitine/acylcarnitine transporter 20/29
MLKTDAFGKENQAYRGALDCARKVLQKEGIKGLYRGFWPCIIRGTFLK